MDFVSLLYLCNQKFDKEWNYRLHFTKWTHKHQHWGIGQVLRFCNLGEARVLGRALLWEIGAELWICHVRTQRLGQQKINDHQDHWFQKRNWHIVINFPLWARWCLPDQSICSSLRVQQTDPCNVINVLKWIWCNVLCPFISRVRSTEHTYLCRSCIETRPSGGR